MSSEQKFIINDCYAPNITLGAVFLSLEELRSHVEGSSKSSSSHVAVIDHFFSKTKISDFEKGLFDEDIFGFEISE
jgi:hypothetical protein